MKPLCDRREVLAVCNFVTVILFAGGCDGAVGRGATAACLVGRDRSSLDLTLVDCCPASLLAAAISGGVCLADPAGRAARRITCCRPASSLSLAPSSVDDLWASRPGSLAESYISILFPTVEGPSQLPGRGVGIRRAGAASLPPSTLFSTGSCYALSL